LVVPWFAPHRLRLVARYDGLAAWYDEYIHDGGEAPGTDEARRLVRELLGTGTGKVLDLGCGGGVFFDVLAGLGWSVVGIDESEDQLRFAAARAAAVGAELVHGDATRLSFPAESFDSVVALFLTTDVEPWEVLIAEGARVLRRNGRFVFLSLHPGFVGPHASYQDENGLRVVGAGYHKRGRHYELAVFRPGGLRSRIGAVHVPLVDLLNAFVEAGLAIQRLEESRDDPPLVLAGTATKS
jgi:SAM-dependent methyltransferase